MNIESNKLESSAIRFSVTEDGKEAGRAFLYLIKNDLRTQPYGLLEDVYVDESYRSNGIGSQLVNQVIDTAKEFGCYKLIATSRFEREKVHELYKRLGFEKHGVEFRMDFDGKEK